MLGRYSFILILHVDCCLFYSLVVLCSGSICPINPCGNFHCNQLMVNLPCFFFSTSWSSPLPPPLGPLSSSPSLFHLGLHDRDQKSHPIFCPAISRISSLLNSQRWWERILTHHWDRRCFKYNNASIQTAPRSWHSNQPLNTQCMKLSSTIQPKFWNHLDLLLFCLLMCWLSLSSKGMWAS